MVVVPILTFVAISCGHPCWCELSGDFWASDFPGKVIFCSTCKLPWGPELVANLTGFPQLGPKLGSWRRFVGVIKGIISLQALADVVFVCFHLGPGTRHLFLKFLGEQTLSISWVLSLLLKQLLLAEKRSGFFVCFPNG